MMTHVEFLFLFVFTPYGTIQVWCFEFRQPTQYLSFFNLRFLRFEHMWVLDFSFV